ncbi:uncharacterized protein DUF397 [Actinomadura pelletieri DSM 43383]|uniref:Uncharacterized protein DUF397 n=1 Tax=Actinomadura pelletieri DSM 43383 TaxID=1120940 RepID=A0A495QXP0_9ACTN|nr:DUF397 domain-containing protein [Actinomadura pelletieri]RKS78827.1 uncharacterized protein DUF397 [Actinomadura pelletieri DSM 43383]
MTPPTWRKSSRSTQGTSGECVEVARLTQAIGVRDSKRPESGHLALTTDQFAALVQWVKNSV